MADPAPRVFISSVMQGYESFRDAAAEGIRRAGGEPVRAEDFPAGGHSPRNACLDGVRSSDAIVLLLGARYGFIGPSGIAVTEEEYEEAKRTHKRVLVFLEDVAIREPQQQAFADRVQSYVDGHWRKTFQNRDALTKLVREAVAEADLSATPGLEDRARTRIEGGLHSGPPESQGIVWLKTVWATMRDEEVTDPVDLGGAEFERRVQRLAHECEPRLFSYQQAKQSTALKSSLSIQQGDPGDWREPRDLAIVEIHSDGTLSITQNVSGTEARSSTDGGAFDMYFLAPSAVRRQSERAWAFAKAWWNGSDPYRRHEPLLFNLALHHVGSRRWAEPIRSSDRGITIPGECPHDPLVVFDRPRRVSRADVGSSTAEIGRCLAMIERLFQEWEGRW